MENNTQDKGFTLVELLIVIVILGILATITVFAVRGITDQGQNSACDTDRATLETAVEAFYAQNGTLVDPVEANLVPKYLVSVSDGYNIQAGATPGLATVVPSAAPAPGGECVGR